MKAIYSINDWERHYEFSDSKKTSGPLTWVRIRTSRDGSGYRRMASEKDRADLFSAWVLMVEVAASLPRDLRGKLVASDGHPLDSEDLAMMTGFPEKTFERSLKFFSSQKMRWLTCSESTAASEDVSGSIRTNPETSGYARKLPSRLEESRVEESRVEDISVAPGFTTEVIYQAYPRKQGKADALKAIQKALDMLKCGGQDSAWLLGRVTAYAAATKSWPAGDEKFIPHPATWFNRASYHDDPATWERTKTGSANPARIGHDLPADYYKGDGGWKDV